MRPKPTPRTKLDKLRYMKVRSVVSIYSVCPMSWSWNLMLLSIALNKRMATASLSTPSPKRIEFKVEYFSGVIRVITATVSVEHSTAAIR